MTEAPSPFIPNTKIRYAWDSTSLSALKMCPRYYYYTMIEDWGPRTPSTHLTFGSIYHKALEDYHRALIEGTPKEDALRSIIRYALITSKGMEPLKGKTREGLIRTLIWYVDRWHNDNCKTVVLPSGAPALELSFQYQSDLAVGSYGINYIFCGHLDRVVNYEGMVLVSDHKTSGSTLGDYYFDQFSPDNQMSFYPYMAQRVFSLPARGVLIDAAQVAITFSEFGRAVAHRTPAQLEEWWTETQHYLRQMVIYAETNFWPMNDKSCRGCAFRSICKKDPAVRPAFLAANFIKKHWNPLAERTPGEHLDLSGD